MTEQKYPIYRFEARWNQSTYANNGTSGYHMYKEYLTPEQIESETQRLWHEILEYPTCKGVAVKDLEPELLSLSFTFVEEATWCLRWFSHVTYNQFATQEEAFESFERFVDEKRPLHENCELPSDYLKQHPEIKTYCLMGAEDSWRWKICGCEKCKEEGITAILH